jgi:lysozyme family protein
MSFDLAFQCTVGAEGGYSNNAADPGGETMWGITARVARAHGYAGSMHDMPIATAKAIYQASYWDLIHLGDVDKISPAIAAEMFDTGVNCGVAVPVKFLQRALNAFNRQGKDYPDMPADGLFGARSADALRRYLQVRGALGEKVMLMALNAQQGIRYFEIAEGRPTSEDFEFGWWANRVLT